MTELTASVRQRPVPVEPFPAVRGASRPSYAASSCCAASYNLFQEPWWLDAVAAGEWDEVCVKRGGQIAARLPFVHKKVAGRILLLQPKLTPYLGPWLRPSTAKRTHQLGEEKELMQALIDALPKFDVFRQCFAPEITYWLPFHWRGFRQTTRYTYRLGPLDDLPAIWANLRDNIRREIRKAMREITIRDTLDMVSFAGIWEKTFLRQGLRLPVSKAVLHRVEIAANERKCCKVLAAQDARGRIHAALLLLWDPDCCYYLLSGGDPELRSSGAGSLLVWEAIQFAATVSRQFDFEGSMIESIERFFRAFGGEPTPYFSLSKLSGPATFFAGLYQAGCGLFARQSAL